MKHESKLTKYLRIFDIIIVGLLILLGGILMFSKYFINVPWNIRFILALFIISYGAYRLVSIVQKSKIDSNEEDTD
jgi:hypothetical protein